MYAPLATPIMGRGKGWEGIGKYENPPLVEEYLNCLYVCDLTLGLPVHDLTLGLPVRDLTLGLPVRDLTLGLPVCDLALGGGVFELPVCT